MEKLFSLILIGSVGVVLVESQYQSLSYQRPYVTYTQRPLTRPQNREGCDCGGTWLEPVCGSDQNSYYNMCTLNCAARSKPGLTWRHSGECQPDSFGNINLISLGNIQEASLGYLKPGILKKKKLDKLLFKFLIKKIIKKKLI